MPSSERLAAIRDRYDKRAPTYDGDTSFHFHQAADYIMWMSIKPGYDILDLACGTGGVTIPAAKAVGPSGSVIGVDISGASLDIAREKASKEGLDVTFLEHDIANLGGLRGIEEGKFDLITCASAFVLVENPSEVIKAWAKLLKKGGRMIFDAPTGGTLIKNVLLERVARELKVNIFGHRLDSERDVRKLLTDAGLEASESFVTESYESGNEELNVKKARETFDDMVRKEKWTGEWYKDLAKPELIDNSRAAFREEIEKIADKDGKVVSELRLVMAVGKKL